MAVPILPTKLYIPVSRKNLVPRPKLRAKFAGDLSKKLTLVSAPAGFGKTTAISAITDEWKRPFTWISLDSGDNDSIRFFSYFFAAIKKIFPDFGEKALQPLREDQPPDIEFLLNQLVNEILEIHQPFVIVLDDYHVISNPEIHDMLVSLIDHQPTNLHLVISSRSDPPWPLARLRARNQITEIRTQDLRFSKEEAAEFLNEIMLLKLTPDQIGQLEQRTEGWIAGLQMAAISLQGKSDIDDFLVGFSGKHRFVMDYLLEEVLNQQEQALLDFLLKTSILTRLNEDLCEVVSGQDAGFNFLGELERSNLFLVPLDDERVWYRYHHLFADLLQKQLRMKNPELLPELHRRASNWYARAGFIFEAVEHAFKTDDLDYAADQLEAHALDLIQRGEIGMTRKWIGKIPNVIIRDRTILCVAQAWASTKFATVDLAEELLAQAERTLNNDRSTNAILDRKTRQFLSNQISVLQVVIARIRGDSTKQQQDMALAALDNEALASDDSARATLLFRLGLSYLDLGKHEQAEQTFSRAVALGKSSGNYYAVHVAAYGQMVIAKLRGELHKITTISQENMGITRNEHGPQYLSGIDSIMLGSILYEMNQLDDAHKYLSQGLALVEQIGISEVPVKGMYALACVEIAIRGKTNPSDLAGITEGNQPKLTSYAEALEIRILLLLLAHSPNPQFKSRVIHWADKQDLIILENSTYDWEIQVKLIYARALCFQFQQHPDSDTKAKLNAFLDFITAQQEMLLTLGWNGTLLEVKIVTAVVLEVLGRNADALATLKQVIQMAEPEGYIRLFVDEGETMRSLLRQAQSNEIDNLFIQTLIEAFRFPTIISHFIQEDAPLALIEQLSKREIEVLQLLNSLLTVPEIAAETHLAPTTIRTHVQNIYSKLGVHKRAEAIQRAKELKLL